MIHYTVPEWATSAWQRMMAGAPCWPTTPGKRQKRIYGLDIQERRGLQ